MTSSLSYRFTGPTRRNRESVGILYVINLPLRSRESPRLRTWLLQAINVSAGILNSVWEVQIYVFNEAIKCCVVTVFIKQPVCRKTTALLSRRFNVLITVYLYACQFVCLFIFSMYVFVLYTSVIVVVSLSASLCLCI